MNHTKEPWHMLDNGIYIELCNDKERIGDVCASKFHRNEDDEEVDFSQENARRIIACVNACAGLSTDDLEKSGLISAVGNELLLTEKERDAYRDLCVELRKVLHNHYWRDCSNYSGNIERFLKKAEKLLGEKK